MRSINFLLTYLLTRGVARILFRGIHFILALVLVLVDVGRRVHCELLLPHSRFRRFLKVFTVLALTTL